MTTLGNLIKDGLARKELTRYELADKLGIVAISVSKWTSTGPTKAPVPWRHWRRICAVLEIPWARWLKTAQQENPQAVELYYRYMMPSQRPLVRRPQVKEG